MAKLRFVAFYLPQFHRIPENDAWWGMGFTEWQNVAKSRPLFPGHRQPHIPADLGFYDLRSPNVLAAQAELARGFGVDAFCFYHYWFAGKQLLEYPVESFRAQSSVSLEYCLCWANESWTRRWDGKDDEVLIAQDYDDYDADAHIHALATHFRDPRYLKVDGKCVFVIYRPGEIPRLEGVVERWQHAARSVGLAGLYLVGCSTTKAEDRRVLASGFEAIIDFVPKPERFVSVDRDEPLWMVALSRLLKGEAVTIPTGRGALRVRSYRKLVRDATNTLDLRHWPSVMPSWDNSPRRGSAATIIQNSNPEVYKRWLLKAGRQAMQEGTGMVFINAWNEWGEGCHLEPDTAMGHAFGNATARAKAALLTATSHQLDLKWGGEDERGGTGVGGTHPGTEPALAGNSDQHRRGLSP